MFNILFWLFLPVLLSQHAFAWGPATHLYYGLNVLENLSQLIPSMQMVLGANPLAYLYGCVSADIVLAKKFGKAASHCHRFENGIKLIEKAQNDQQHAFALGYLSHLAADTHSHNSYVPGKAVESAPYKGILNHMIWELRFDHLLVTPQIIQLFSVIANEEHKECDALFEKVIQTRILDFTFNKKIFNQIMILQSVNHWQAMLSKINQNKDQALQLDLFEAFKKKSMFATFDFLNNGMNSQTVLSDPIGDIRQKQALNIRKSIQKHPKKIDTVAILKTAELFYRHPTETIPMNALPIKIL